MEQYQIVVAVVAGALTFLTFGNKLWAGWLKIWRFFFGAPHVAIQQTIDERCEDFREEVVKIYISQEEAYAALSQRIEEVSARQEEKIIVMDSMIEGQRAILRDRLFQSCEYYIEKGEISTPALENLTSLHKAYNNLNGNGTGDTLYQQAKNLKIKVMKGNDYE